MAKGSSGWDSWSMAQLRRPRFGRVIAGVCAAIADRFGWNPWVVRVVFIASCLLPGPQFIVYIALWILIPAES
jgi:phage shock protein PspC (stress-responsive transcriptional regulator)